MNAEGLLLEFSPLFGEVRLQLSRQGFLPAKASDEEWNSIFLEFLRFLSVKDLATDGGLPPRLDEVWHACILNTRDYYALCMKLRGCFIHHTTASEQDDLVERQSRVDQTVLNYRKRLLQEPSPAVVEEPEEEEKPRPPFKIRFIRRPSPYQIFVKPISGKTYSLQVRADWTIADVKQSIHALKNDVPPDQQRLIFAGMNLEDGRTCADYNLCSDCTIHLVRRVTGC